MNQDYVTEYKAQTVDGVQTVTFKINPKAAFNDGTPIDVNAVKSYQTIYTAAHPVRTTRSPLAHLGAGRKRRGSGRRYPPREGHHDQALVTPSKVASPPSCTRHSSSPSSSTTA